MVQGESYQKAFIAYLRRGTPIEISYKREEVTSTHYIWRTQLDDKVRPEHAAREGRIFAWNNPPPGGHPGSEKNCRCVAVPVEGNEYANQILISSVNDNPDPWTNEDFVFNYLFGQGIEVTLQKTGYLQKIIDYYSLTLGVYNRVNSQILDLALGVGEGGFTYRFRNTYDFEDIKFTFRNSTISGVFEGEVKQQFGLLVVRGIITYDFFDVFEDIFSVVEALVYIGLTREEAQRFIANLGTIVAESYNIIDQWKTKFQGAVRAI